MFHPFRLSIIALALTLILVLGGCQAQAFSASTAPPENVADAVLAEVTFTAKGDGYSGPGSIPAGWVRLVLNNEGSGYDHIQLLKLNEGKRIDELMAALEDDPAWPDWVEMYGGPNASDPGTSSVATVNLTPGNYVLLSWVPDRNGIPRFLSGMIAPLTVTEAEAQTAPEPAADMRMDFVDFNYVLSQPLVAGPQTIRVTNNGEHAHEVWVTRLGEGKTVTDLFAALAPDAPADAWKFNGIGGITEIEPGAHAYFQVDLEPGRYALLCFVSDPDQGAPHAAMGMVQTFDVE